MYVFGGVIGGDADNLNFFQLDLNKKVWKKLKSAVIDFIILRMKCLELEMIIVAQSVMGKCTSLEDL
jgi:hypothetical protein